MSKLSRFIAAGVLSALTAGSLALAAPPVAAEEPEPASVGGPISCAGQPGDEPALQSSCEPADPCEGVDPPTWCFFEAPANGFSWSVPNRFSPTIAGFRWDAANVRYDPSHVHPAAWPADFNACRTAEDQELSSSGQPTASTYTFVVAGTTRSQQSCLLRHSFPDQGTYEARVTVSGPNAAGPFTQQVTIRDILVVSVGDSAASGEGNPDVPRNGDQPAQWVDRRCHRSAKSGPAQAAAALENADPHTSVTFLSFACSGASIDRYYYDPVDGQDYYTQDPYKPSGQGILGPYRGTEPTTTGFLPSQMDQMKAAVACAPNPDTCPHGQRRIDSLLLSAGINDIGFGPIAATCLKEWACESGDQTVTGANGTKVSLPTRFASDASLLQGRYTALASALNRSGLNIARTYLTEYPDPTTKDDGTLCPEMMQDVAWTAHFDAEETAWVRNTVVPTLNGAVRSAASAHGWVHVDDIASAFVGHGYCASEQQRWIRTATESAALQGPDDKTKNTGTLHPTEAGHRIYRDRILGDVRPDIAALPIDRGFFDTPKDHDIVMTGGTGWKSIAVARSNGNGSYAVTAQGVGDFGGWSATPNVKRLTGDFNGDGRTDIALTGGVGWSSLPVAMSNAQGGFTVTNTYIGDFAGFAATSNVRVSAGDFNNDGRTDLALTGGAGWSSLPVAFSNGNGSFNVTNSYIGSFASWAAPSAVRITTGDLNGDRRADLVLVGASSSTLPVAFSNGNGTFNVTSSYVSGFPSFGYPSHIKVSSGDFNADGRTDLALTGGAGWNTLPVAFSNGNGTFNATNTYVGDFAGWAGSGGVRVTPGDFNADGRTDLALTGVTGWSSLPMAHSNGNGSFTVTNQAATEFAPWSATANVKTVAGDFNGDGRTDLALTGASGWSSLPTAFSNGNGTVFVTNRFVPVFGSWASSPGVSVHAARLPQ